MNVKQGDIFVCYHIFSNHQHREDVVDRIAVPVHRTVAPDGAVFSRSAGDVLIR